MKPEQVQLLEALVNAKLVYDNAAAAVQTVPPGNYTVPGIDGKMYMVTVYNFNTPDVRGPVLRLT